MRQSCLRRGGTEHSSGRKCARTRANGCRIAKPGGHAVDSGFLFAGELSEASTRMNFCADLYRPQKRTNRGTGSNKERSSTALSEASPDFPSQLSTPEASSPLPPKSRRQRKPLEWLITKAFVGPGGIRAGWRLPVFLVIFIALIAGLGFMARTFSHTRSPLPPHYLNLEPSSTMKWWRSSSFCSPVG